MKKYRKQKETRKEIVQSRNKHEKFWGVKKRKNKGMKKGRNEAAEEMNKDRKKKFRNQEARKFGTNKQLSETSPPLAA